MNPVPTILGKKLAWWQLTNNPANHLTWCQDRADYPGREVASLSPTSSLLHISLAMSLHGMWDVWQLYLCVKRSKFICNCSEVFLSQKIQRLCCI